MLQPHDKGSGNDRRRLEVARELERSGKRRFGLFC